jgi:hypothetical protein
MLDTVSYGSRWPNCAALVPETTPGIQTITSSAATRAADTSSNPLLLRFCGHHDLGNPPDPLLGPLRARPPRLPLMRRHMPKFVLRAEYNIPGYRTNAGLWARRAGQLARLRAGE